MSILHIAFYPSDWLAGTRGMSDTETGVYITLIARMYEMAGPIERDDMRLQRLCGSKTKSAFVKILNFLIEDGKISEIDGFLTNFRVEKEIQIAIGKSDKAKAAANSRWDRKPNKINGGHDADASMEHGAKHSLEHMPQACQPEPEPEPDIITTTTTKEDSVESGPEMAGGSGGFWNDYSLPNRPEDIAERQRWQKELGLDDESQRQVITNVIANDPDRTINSLRYFRPAMMRYAVAKNGPAIKIATVKPSKPKTADEQIAEAVRLIKTGLPYRCRDISIHTAQEAYRRGMVSRSECRQAQVIIREDQVNG